MKRSLSVGMTIALFFLSLPAPAGAVVGGCGEARREGMPPCCLDFTVPSGGTDEDRTCVGPATRYLMTVHNMGFEDSAGNVSWHGSGTTFDMAAVDSGQSVGAFISGVQLPDGTYPYMRAVLGQTYTIDADITTADARRCSGTVTGAPPHLPRQCNDDLINPLYNGTDEIDCTNDGKFYVRDNQQSIVVANGTGPSLNMAFYVESASVCLFPSGGSGDAALSVGDLFVRIRSN